MKCLDTDVLVAILRNTDDGRRVAQELDSEGRSATTSINAFEIFYDTHRSEHRTKNVEEAKKLLQRLEVIPLTQKASEMPGELAASLEAKGETIDYRDAMIAGVALEDRLILETRNRRHSSRIGKLRVQSR